MVPVYVKGGAWSNIEDQILKAAVSKYGLNQWTRVASLLAKKTAKQAKARWNEYLDPRIHTSDWKPEEDTKLLNLARLLPNQWRSIASTLGRTATQCVERYQRLLDDTAGTGSVNDLGLSGLGLETMASTGPNEVQIGDLNVDAETKEARPDAVDLDDDEKEMLSEARARLANTKGKKATRKAREKMLEESKRIALLQKRRELKQAGINTKLRAPKKKYATQKDYNADIVFEHRPTEGFYDTTEEIHDNDSKLVSFERQVNVSGLKEDSKNKEKRPREEKKPQEIERAAVLIGEDQLKKRKLELPKPEINSDEVNSLAKKDSDEIQQLILERVTRAETMDNKLKSAANKVREYTSQSSALLTTGELDVYEIQDSPLTEVAGLKSEVKLSILERLASLPKPKNDFEIVAEAEPEKRSISGSKATLTEDQGEIERLRLIAQDDQRKAALLRRSFAVQKELPIPDVHAGFTFGADLGDVEKEMVKLMRSDFSKIYKVPGPLVADLDEDSRTKVLREVQELIDAGELTRYEEEFCKHHADSYVLEVETSSVISELQGLVENCNKLEKKVSIQIGGYVNIEQKLTDDNITLLQELKDVDRAERAFQMLYESELIVIEARQETLREEVDRLVTAEQRAQEVLLNLKRKATN